METSRKMQFSLPENFVISWRFKVFENISIFEKIQTVFLHERAIFSKRNFEKLNIHDKIFWLFWKKLKIFNFYDTYKCIEISREFCYLVEMFIKKHER